MGHVDPGHVHPRLRHGGDHVGGGGTGPQGGHDLGPLHLKGAYRGGLLVTSCGPDEGGISFFVDKEQGFGRAHRLRLRSEIDRVFREGVRRDGSMFSFRILRREDPTPRLLVIVGRKVGGAVVRNRIRRGVREGFRTHKELFAYCDVVVIPRPEVARLRPGEIARRFLQEFREVWNAPGDTPNERGLRAKQGRARAS
ncbi:MAG TPA: ribonuclease P protein component [Candidatus Acetothermia bacterium]|nr:ribonuclease P protein component [Candidatus Acetothermia bacterium]